jgi:hypothetical protein
LSSSFGLDSFCIGCSKRNEEPAEIVEEHQLRGLRGRRKQQSFLHEICCYFCSGLGLTGAWDIRLPTTNRKCISRISSSKQVENKIQKRHFFIKVNACSNTFYQRR